MDIVFIENLKVDTVIGVYAWERKIRQQVHLDIEMAKDNREAAGTDDISQALDYKAIGKRIEAFVKEAEYQLVETLAEAIAALVMKEFNVPWLRLKLTKPKALTIANNVGVIIERGKKAE